MRALLQGAGVASEGRLTLALIAESPADLRGLLQETLGRLEREEAIEEPGRIHLSLDPCGPEGLAWLFPGQGSQRVGMLRDLRGVLPGFEEGLRARDAEAEALLGRSLVRQFLDPESDPALEAELKLTHNAQLSVGLASYALAESLAALGIAPRFLAGHSYGELPALSYGGAYPFAELIQLSAERGRLLGGAAAKIPGSMLAVARGPDWVREQLDGLPGPLVLANINGPRQVVASGTLAGIAALEERCREARVATTRLKTACAFHSPLMAPVRAEWEAFLAEREFAAPRGVVSSVSAKALSDESEVRPSLAEQIVAPVRWIETVEALYQAGARVFLEVGPSRVLSGLTQRILAGRPHQALPLEAKRPKGTPRLRFLDLLARLASQGIPVAWERFSHGYERGLAEAPGQDLARTYFASGRGAVETFFAQQERALKSLGPASPGDTQAVLAQMLETNRAVLQELLETQAAGLAYFGGQTPALPEPPGGLAAKGEAPATSGDVAELLRAEICKLTGFPPEVVLLTSEFEGDLGLSSINLAELWAAFLPRFPALEGQESELFGLRSVGELAEVLRRLAGPDLGLPAQERASPGSPTSAEPDPNLAFGGEGTRSQAPREPEPAINPLAVFREHLRERFQVEEEELNAEGDFEDDFGFDVFSRRSAISSLLGGDPTCRLLGRELLGARSLGEVEALLRRVDPEFRDDEAGRLLRLRWEPAERPTAEGSLPDALLLIGDPAQIERYAPALSAAGTRVERLALEAGATGWMDSGREVSWEDVAGLRERLAEAPPTWVFLALDPTPGSGLGAPDWAARLEQVASAAFALPLAVDLDAPRTWALVGSSACSPALAAPRGLWRALACERPALRIAALWSEALPEPARLPERLASAWGGERVEADLWVGPEGLRTRTLVEATVEGEPTPLRLERGALVLATGGGAGITAELGLALVERYGVTLVACGRTPEAEAFPFPELGREALDEAGQAELRRLLFAAVEGQNPAEVAAQAARVRRQRELARTRARVEEAGGRFVYRVLDLGDAASREAGLRDLREELGPIQGLIHGAGRTADARLERKDLAELHLTLGAKAGALGALYRVFADDPLRFVALLGSLSAYTGRAGQTDYCAANEVLREGAAAWGREVDYVVRAISWGVWSEAGLARGYVVRRMQELGLTGVSNAAGRSAFLSELERGDPDLSEVLLTTRSNLEFARREAGS